MGRIEFEGVKYETRGSGQGAMISKAFDKLEEYMRRKKLENFRPEIKFHRSNLTYYHLKPFDMHQFILSKVTPKPCVFIAAGCILGFIFGNRLSKLIYDQNERYHYLVLYPKQMKKFDDTVEAISSRFWKIGHDYFGDFIVPDISTPEGFYNFTYAVKNKIFKIEERKEKSAKEFTVLKTTVAQSDTDLQQFDSAVGKQDAELKRALWKVEEIQAKQEAERQ